MGRINPKANKTFHRALDQRGLTQAGFEHRLSLPPGTISNAILHKSYPPEHIQEQIIGELHVPGSILFPKERLARTAKERRVRKDVRPPPPRWADQGNRAFCQALEYKGLSVASLVRKLHIAHKTISDAILFIAYPSNDIQDQIIIALEVSGDTLFPEGKALTRRDTRRGRGRGKVRPPDPEIVQVSNAELESLQRQLNSDPESYDPYYQVEPSLMRVAIADSMATITEREQRIIALRFGLGGERSKTLEEVAREMGVSRERIRQIEGKGLRKLRHPTRAGRLRGFRGIGDNIKRKSETDVPGPAPSPTPTPKPKPHTGQQSADPLPERRFSDRFHTAAVGAWQEIRLGTLAGEALQWAQEEAERLEAIKSRDALVAARITRNYQILEERTVALLERIEEVADRRKTTVADFLPLHMMVMFNQLKRRLFG